MEITRTSVQSGKTRTIDLDITQEQLDMIASGEGHIQAIVPHLSPDDREFILTGITAEEWEELFGGDEEEGDDLEATC